MATAREIGLVIAALIQLIPLILTMVREGQIRASAYSDIEAAFRKRFATRMAAVDDAMNGPDVDPYAKNGGKK